LYIGGAADNSFGYTQSSSGVGAGVSAMTGTWHYLVTARNGLAVTVYLDGVSLGSGNLPGNESVSFGYLGARNCCAGLYYNGALDEVRLSNVVRSADWVSTEYKNQQSPSTFYGVGNEVVP